MRRAYDGGFVHALGSACLLGLQWLAKINKKYCRILSTISVDVLSSFQLHDATPTHQQTNTMKTHITIAFCGNFRPLHIEAETIAEAVKIAAKRISCPSIGKTLKTLHKDMDRQRKAGIGIVSACSDHGKLSIRIADYPRDKWLDSLTNEMPENPSISYS